MAEPQRKAVVDSDGNVVNVILVDPESDYDPGEDLILVDDVDPDVDDVEARANIGGKWDGSKFIDPPGLNDESTILVPDSLVADALRELLIKKGVSQSEIESVIPKPRRPE